jgi:hypothetical protein
MCKTMIISSNISFQKLRQYDKNSSTGVGSITTDLSVPLGSSEVSLSKIYFCYHLQQN